MSCRLAYPYAVYRREKDSKMMIVLGLLFVTFLILSIAVIVAWAVISDGFKNLGGLPDVCTSATCVSTASRLSVRVDQYERPCENFYRYTCGKYGIRNSGEIANLEAELLESTRNRLKALLERPMDASDSDSARFAKKLYLSCSDSVSRQSAGLKPLRELLRNVPCGPIYKDCTNFNTSIYSWERHAAMVASLLGQSNIIVADRSVHPNDSRRVILSLSPPDLTSLLGPIESDLARSAQANSDEYNRLLVTAVKQRLLNEPTQSLLYTDPVENRDLVDEVADFMISLHKARLPSEAKSAMRRNEYRITLDQRALTSRYSEIDWTAFFNAELNSALRVNESDLIIVEDQFYFRTLANIIRGRPARAVADYLTLMTVISLKALLPSDYQSSSIINSATSSASSWRLCVDQMMRFEPTMKIYLDEYVNAKQRNDLTLLANDIRSAFLKVLPVSSEENFYNTRNVQFKIAASNRILTGQASATYDKINFNASDYFTTYVNAMKQQRNEEIHQIGTSMQPDDSPHFPSLASASIFYDADENSVIIPASTLQPPFILPSENAPKYTVFATMGSFIGQALASSVEDLSTNTTIACYQEKINLVNRTGTSTAMQSQTTLSEIYATLRTSLGLEAALQAYHQFLSNAQLQKEVPLPAFTKQTSLQQFFIIFGSMLCDGSDPTSVAHIQTSVNAAAKNSIDFSRAFGCTSSDRLRHDGKC